MATQPTQNAVPSESPRDLKFNAGKIDEYVTSMGWTYTDRFGFKHYTAEGINYLAQQAMNDFGYITLNGVSFTTGATVSTPNEVLLNTADSQYYKWTGSFASGGKVVPANSTPANSGGIGPGLWLAVGDSSVKAYVDSFISKIASTQEGNGDALIGVKSILTDGTPRTQHDKNADLVTSADVGITSINDATAKIQNLNNSGVTSFLVTDTLNVTQDIPGRVHLSLKEVSQPGSGAIPVRNLGRLNFLPKINKIYNVSSGYDYDYRADSIIKNGSFFVWHGTTIGSTNVGMATSLAASTNAMICAFWRMETTAGATVNSISKITSPAGGLKFNAVYDGSGSFVYIRQNAYGVQAYGQKTFTACIDLEVDQACSMDCYARMRINAINTDEGRPLIVDSENINIPAGRGRYAITFTCPDVDSFRGQETSVNSMEFAFRIFGLSQTIAVKIRGINITPGKDIPHPQKSDIAKDVADADTMYRIGLFRTVGWTSSDATAQKGLTVDLGGQRYTAGTVTLYDMAGAINRVSTYNATGSRTDAVSPTAISVDSLALGFFTVLLNNSSAAGLGGWYIYNAYP
ncbi:tail spike protein [Erwinia phage vB_EhrS_59]|uniref:Tail spike protein n=1 Tax=Erwinia phage vB_EhrS_59 TaxID=2283025 RepID=A0A4Y1NRF3_9CAUD|nr:tail spike protein [Erwinia phage vB_EhrS_59]AXH43539.1 tail spike protein [Erwinia phage vB_EhrS_59]